MAIESTWPRENKEADQHMAAPKTPTCQSVHSYESRAAGDAHQVSVVVGDHGWQEGLVGLKRGRGNH